MAFRDFLVLAVPVPLREALSGRALSRRGGPGRRTPRSEVRNRRGPASCSPLTAFSKSDINFSGRPPSARASGSAGGTAFYPDGCDQVRRLLQQDAGSMRRARSQRRWLRRMGITTSLGASGPRPIQLAPDEETTYILFRPWSAFRFFFTRKCQSWRGFRHCRLRAPPHFWSFRF